MTHILLGISGSISAYKTPDIVRLLRKEGWSVTAILTESALNFVSPLSLSTLSETPCLTPIRFMQPDIPHLALAKSGDVFVGAPISANSLSKLSSGRADDPVSATFSAFEGPTLLAPSMHTEMWEHSGVQSSVSLCQTQGAHFIGPDVGDLASGDYGTGRLVDPKLLVLAIHARLMPHISLSGKRIVVTAGGTSEPIDPVRHLSNASTGYSGEVLAHMASFYGAQVTLITSKPLQIPNPHISTVVSVSSSSDLCDALHEFVPGCDRLYMAAAVSDFMMETSPTKLSRSGTLTLTLKQTPDILKSLAPLKGTSQFIGYCLSDGDLESVAKRKLIEKGLDAIVANTPDQIGKPLRSATIYTATSKREDLSNLSLPQFSNRLLRLSL